VSRTMSWPGGTWRALTLNAWAHVPRHVGTLPAWLCVHLAFDLLFIAGYFLLAWTLLTASKSWILGRCRRGSGQRAHHLARLPDLLFNSTAVRTGCRAILADRYLAGSLAATPVPVPAAAAPLTCGLGSAAPAAGSYDLFAKLPCLTGIDTATAAMLSARFPFVTPSGVVHGCQGLSGTAVEQFADGGYADSSGLGTLAGLAPGLMAAVRQYNSAAVTGTPAGQPVTLVVPVTVYLGNSPRWCQGLADAGPIPGRPPRSSASR
jgi:hypothetical protein